MSPVTMQIVICFNLIYWEFLAVRLSPPALNNAGILIVVNLICGTAVAPEAE